MASSLRLVTEYVVELNSKDDSNFHEMLRCFMSLLTNHVRVCVGW